MQSAIAGSIRDHDPINDDDVGTIATSLEQAVKNPRRSVPDARPYRADSFSHRHPRSVKTRLPIAAHVHT